MLEIMILSKRSCTVALLMPNCFAEMGNVGKCSSSICDIGIVRKDRKRPGGYSC